ncbi:hypothetical protein [Bradyrhizobium sp. HKCCYLRH3061]|uniref:hypothetical protein n=1 Tax=Bradyrhizobium TaxID=374 RepID=UPI003EB71189
MRDDAQPVLAGMLQIADRAKAEAQEAGEIVVCPRFPLPSRLTSYTPTAEPS